MIYVTLDSIVKSLLLKTGRPVHYYYEFLKYAVDGLKELSSTTIGRINTVELPVSDYKAVPLPVDYVDYLKVGYKVGERLLALPHDSRLLRQYNYEGNTKVPHGTEGCYGLSFCEVKERGEIQLSADYPCGTVVLQYLSDGLGGDAATEVDTLAQDCIEKYILWQRAAHRSDKREESFAEQRYIKSFKLLRAKKSGLTRETILGAMNRRFEDIPFYTES